MDGLVIPIGSTNRVPVIFDMMTRLSLSNRLIYMTCRWPGGARLLIQLKGSEGIWIGLRNFIGSTKQQHLCDPIHLRKHTIICSGLGGVSFFDRPGGRCYNYGFFESSNYKFQGFGSCNENLGSRTEFRNLRFMVKLV